MQSFRVVFSLALLIGVADAQASIEIYEVDPAYRQEVFEILEAMLDVPDESRRGRVQLLPTGQLVVDTLSDQRQLEVAALLAAIADSEPPATPTVTLRYWVLHGVPGGTMAAGFPNALDGVVRELEAMHGPLGVEIIDAASVSAITGEVGRLDNDRWNIWQYTDANGNRANAQIAITANQLQEIRVELSLTQGEFVVLGAGTSDRVSEGGVLAIVVTWPED